MNTLEFAIQMELDGEKYYREQAELNKGNPLNSVCNLMADEEKKHAEILEGKKSNLAYELPDSKLPADAKNIFTDAKDIEVSGKQHTQLLFYRTAAEMEKKSIDLYSEFLAGASTDDEKKLFEYLVQQETKHLELIEELDRLLTHAEDWIESPEFGRREDEY